ncbi:hypothetical protein FB45DRAFT_1030980 [Roridomyces roridus]|uniref:SWIM-type domain-containing protein n=1 Tax=Roridomyces roridus TaxID=1738132 RepID=A0AAD7BLY3_9AGAR|nr:hypothetical protein FB45DRAFT_1030980 [Roridomyces roridus]
MSGPKRRGRPPKPKKRRLSPTATPSTSIAPPPAGAASTTQDTVASDPSLGTPLTGDDARHVLLAAQGATTSIAAAALPAHRLFLNAIPHEASKGWRKLATIPIDDLASWFDNQLNDYNPYEMSPDQTNPSELRAVEVKWVGHPGDSPRDPRARRCYVRWPVQRPPAEEIQLAISAGRPVVRWDLRCAGVEDRDWSAVAESEAEEDEEELPKLPRWKECSNLVKLHVEVYPADLGTAVIWQQHDHPVVTPADCKKGLKFSRLQRTSFLEVVRLHGLKVSTLVIESRRAAESPTVYGRTAPLPEWRQATRTQITSLHIAAKLRHLLDRNPWRATHLLVQGNMGTGRTFCYNAHDFSKADSKSKFTLGLTDEYSLDSGIAFSIGPNGGLGSDQSWRHKSQNRAAMSLLTTIDEEGHMVPVSVFLSAKANTETILSFLCGTHDKIVTRAQAIIQNPETVSTLNRPDEIVATIRRNAITIVAEGWQIRRIMIDKHYPSLRAIQAFIAKYNLKGVSIRLCQFHVVDTILIWQWADGNKGLAVKIPQRLKIQIIFLFRFVQRARTRDEFDTLSGDFLEAVRGIIMSAVGSEDDEDEDEGSDGDGDQSPPPTTAQGNKPRIQLTRATAQAMCDAVEDYFTQNWFVDDWIECYTDIGLPPNQGRDRGWNTNNWTESAYKTFDNVILQARQNKRIDRLAVLILHDFLPHYQYWRPRDRPQPQHIVQTHLNAYEIWDRGLVIEKRPKSLYDVHVVVDGEARTFEVQMNPMKCFCLAYQQSGLDCAHTLAAKLFVRNGPVEVWHEQESKSEKLSPKTRKKPGGGKEPDDENLRKQFYQVLQLLEQADEFLVESADLAAEPAFQPVGPRSEGFGAMGTEVGRPRNTQPLQGWRHEPSFSRRPGAHAVGRMGPNSIFSGNFKHVLSELYSPHEEPPASPAPAAQRRRPAPNTGGLTTEEIEMQTSDVWRWAAGTYTMRAEEVMTIIDILNYSSLAKQNGWLFVCCAPVCITPEVVEQLDWSVPLSLAELRSKGLGFIADVLQARNSMQVNRLIVFHLLANHWTLFDHVLGADSGPNVVRLNPMPPIEEGGIAPESFSISDQRALAVYFDPIRLEKVAQHNPTAFSLPPSHGVLFNGPSSISAFNAVIRRLVASGHVVRIMDQNPDELKEVFALIWIAFRSNPDGVPSDLVQELFARFKPTEDVCSVSDVFSKSPHAPFTADRATEATIAQDRLAALVGADEARVWCIGAHRPTSGDVKSLVEQGYVSDHVLDAYLERFCGTLMPSDFRVLIADSNVTYEMTQAKKNPEGMKPKRATNFEFWFPDDDIFAFGLLLLPWLWNDKWMLLVVHFGQTTISLYDGAPKKLRAAQTAKAATERTLQMLKWEYRARHSSDLPETWTCAVKQPQVPEYSNPRESGLYCIYFATQLTLRRLDSVSWIFGQPERTRVQAGVAAALCTAICEEPVNGLLEGMDDVDLDEAHRHRRIAEAFYPHLASTDLTRRKSLQDWLIERTARLINPKLGSCLLMTPSMEGEPLLCPAIITQVTDTTARATCWSASRMARSADGKIRGWEAITRELAVENWTELDAVKYPAQLTTAGRLYPSPLIPSQKELAACLDPLVAQIADIYLHPSTENSTDVFAILDARFTAADDKGKLEFYRELLGAPPGEEPFCPADEAYFSSLCRKLRLALGNQGEMARSTSINDHKVWAHGAGRVMFATAACAHYLSIEDRRVALQLLETRQVIREPGDLDAVLQAYGHALRHLTVPDVEAFARERLIVVPGLGEVALPSRRR